MAWPHRRRRSQLDLSRRRRDLSRLKRVATLNAEPHQSIPTRRNLPQAAKVPGLRRAHRRQERHCYAHEMTRNHEARFTRHIHPAMIESGDFLVVVLIAFCVCTLLCSIRYITQSRSTRRILQGAVQFVFESTGRTIQHIRLCFISPVRRAETCFCLPLLVLHYIKSWTFSAHLGR